LSEADEGYTRKVSRAHERNVQETEGAMKKWTSQRHRKPWAQEEFADIKGVISIRISKKNRQHNGQKKKYKRTNNDLQNKHIKLKIE
jgi:hypothetical protein